MNAALCGEMSRKLVDYSDGELPPDEVQALMDHVSTCPDCVKLLKALDLSLSMTTTLWENTLGTTAVGKEMGYVEARSIRQWPWRRMVSVAACIAIAVSAAWIWNRLRPDTGRLPTRAEIELYVQQSGRAARQLMVAEILASCDDTEEMLARHQRYMAETFSEWPSAQGHFE